MGRLIIHHVHTGYDLPTGKFTKVSIESPGVMVCDGVKGDATGFGRNKGQVNITKSGSGIASINARNGEYEYIINQIYATTETLPNPSLIETSFSDLPFTAQYPIWPTGTNQAPQSGTTDATGNPTAKTRSERADEFKQPLADMVQHVPNELSHLRHYPLLYYSNTPYPNIQTLNSASIAALAGDIIRKVPRIITPDGSNDTETRVTRTWTHFRAWIGCMAWAINKIKTADATPFSLGTMQRALDALQKQLDYGIYKFYDDHNATSFTISQGQLRISPIIESGSSAGDAGTALTTAGTSNLWSEWQTEWFEAAVRNNYTSV